MPTLHAIAAAPADCPTDIVFVVDESGSIDSFDFERMKTFLSNLVSRLDVDSGHTRVGLITFATGIGSGFNLSDYSTSISVRNAILSLTHTQGGTRTADALAYVRTTMLTSAAGDRSNAPNVVVVLTDGRSHSLSSTQVSVYRPTEVIDQSVRAIENKKPRRMTSK